MNTIRIRVRVGRRCVYAVRKPRGKSGPNEACNMDEDCGRGHAPEHNRAKWNGQHGVFISDTTGKIGDLRYILLAVQPTRSPMEPNAGMTNTLFAEIDVHTAATLANAGDAYIVKPVKVTDVWVAFKTHYDIGYTDSVENVLKKFRGHHDGFRHQEF